MTDVSRRYIGLAHAVAAHQPALVDAYFGPPELASAERRPLEALAREAEALAAEVEAIHDASRREFLAAQVRALRASLRILSGERLAYREEIRELYDLEPERVPESRFEAATEKLEALLPGSGPTAERERAFRSRVELPHDLLGTLIEAVANELKLRTERRFGLPDDEGVEFRLVSGQPWSGYNWYLGNRRSRVEINTDLPVRLTTLPDLVAHEAYPGHHTEHAWKEAGLVLAQGRLEHSLQLNNAPECVLSEGVATVARAMVVPDAEHRAWLATELAPVAGIPGEDANAMLGIEEARRELRAVSGNAAFLLHEDGAPEAEVLAYLERYGLRSPAEARQNLAFLSDPNFRSYAFTYTEGAALLSALFERTEPAALFGRLLREPFTPGALRRMLAEPAGG